MIDVSEIGEMQMEENKQTAGPPIYRPRGFEPPRGTIETRMPDDVGEPVERKRDASGMPVMGDIPRRQVESSASEDGAMGEDVSRSDRAPQLEAAVERLKVQAAERNPGQPADESAARIRLFGALADLAKSADRALQSAVELIDLLKEQLARENRSR